jgi:hypothetical protein
MTKKIYLKCAYAGMGEHKSCSYRKGDWCMVRLVECPVTV